MKITGDRLGSNGQLMTEEVEVWRRDPLDCIKELIGNPSFRDSMSYEPVQVMSGDARQYSEMWTGNWWWNVQVRTGSFTVNDITYRDTISITSNVSLKVLL